MSKLNKPQQLAATMLDDLREQIKRLPQPNRTALLRTLNDTEGMLATRFDKWTRDLELAQRSVQTQKDYAATLEAQIALIVESNPPSLAS